MGCDIHLEVEQLIEGKWTIVDAPPEYPRDEFELKQLAHYKALEAAGENTGYSLLPYYERGVKKGWMTDRNYHWFAALADVRNENDIEPMSMPRGLPADRDMSAESGVDEEGYSNEGHYGDHSFSYLTLEEMLNWKGWENRFETYGIFDRTSYEKLTEAKWDHMCCPFSVDDTVSYCKGVSGPDVRILDERSEDNVPFPADYNYIAAYWSDCNGDKLAEFREMMMTMASMVDHPSEIRLVFGFDS